MTLMSDGVSIYECSSADQIVDQLKSGAPFNTVASQFSQSPSAADGGDIGWVVQSHGAFYAAEYGFDRELAPDFNANTHQPSLPQGVYVAGVSSAAALVDAPNLAAGVHVGGLYGGLIFGL